MGIIKGKKLMLFVKNGEGGYKSIGFATNHTFSTSASTIDTSHKDVADAASTGAGKWDNLEVDTYSWSITSEHFYANTAEGYTVAEMFNFYTAGTELDVKFGVAPDSTTGVTTGGWVPGTGTMLSGKVIITSIDINAPVGDNASFSLTLTGKGPVTAE